VTENEEHPGAAGAAGATGATGIGAEPVLGAAAERARAALARAPVERPDPAYRARLKRDFVSGAIEVTGVKGHRRARPVGGPGRRVHLRPAAWAMASLAAAAALAVVFGALNRGPQWFVTAARGDGTVRIEGETVAVDDRDAMRRLLVPGAEVETGPNAELDICSNGVLALQLAPGTRMTLPPPLPRWMGREGEMYVRAGELRVTTGSKFSGARLSILSPAAAVEVTGTTFAVIIEDAGTCVCVYEGTAVVGRVGPGGTPSGSADMLPVNAGRRRFVYKDQRPPEMNGMREEERDKLALFRESQRPWMQGAVD
jgi:ferric-dicitrate binding protein FerR (iron transport regulator)